MCTWSWLTTLFQFHLLLLLAIAVSKASSKEAELVMATGVCSGPRCLLNHHDMVQKQAVQTAHDAIVSVSNQFRVSQSLDEMGKTFSNNYTALTDCVKLYKDSELQLGLLLQGQHQYDDAQTWLSGALTSHRSCLDGLNEKGKFVPDEVVHQNVSLLLSRALALYARQRSNKNERPWKTNSDINQGLLASWDVSTSKADFVVAKDGSGNFKTLNEAITAFAQKRQNRPVRVVIYVKSGVYKENEEIERDMKNVMFLGDGMDKTIVTGNRNVIDGATTLSSATFGISGDGFWARDMTFENTAGPQKEQAVALRVSSDLSVFYRCSFKGFQDTLLVHSLRQFYRDCHIYGTIDFIFGNAAAVFQNCDIFIRRPMDHQGIMITAQGRGDLNENTGISIHGSRVAPAPELRAVKGSFKSYLGRPWKKFSRTVFLKTDLDGLIDPKGWKEWNGDFGLSTLFYGEHMNSGVGAITDKRVKWPGYHVLNQPSDAGPFMVSRFIQGESWIPATGVPFSLGI